MNYPEALLMPIMMFADYYLTVFSAILGEKKYSQHYKIQNHELNPLWRKAVARKQWFNPRHIIATLLLSGLCVGLLELGNLPQPIAQGVLGFIFVMYGMAIGRQLASVLTFRYLLDQPEAISGEITLSHSFMLFSSLYQTVETLIPVTLIAVFSRSYFAIGGVLGIIGWMVMHMVWIQKAKQTHASPTGADAGLGE